jgi:MYXO-CTERM domain-containing protein
MRSGLERRVHGALALPWGAALSFAVLVGCAPEAAPSPTPPDAIPEVSYGAATLAEAWEADGAYRRLPALAAPLGATRVGVLAGLTDPEASTPRLEARGVDADGRPGAWRPLEVTWREGAQLVAIVDLDAVAAEAELRVAGADAASLAMLTWSAVVPEPAVERPPVDDDVGASREALRDDLAALGVQPREAWGARATRCSTADPDKYRMAIHHTVTPAMDDPATRLRGIQTYHMDSRGWCDVGYHFLVSLDGRVWEGRPIDFLGTHVGGQNSGNIGVSFIGCFHSSSCSSFPPNEPPDAMVDAAAGLVAGLADIYGIGVSPTTVKGHRDHAGASTSCPGDHLYARLDDIRSGSVEPPMFAAEYVNQTFPLAREPFELAPGEPFAGHLEMRNVGSATWRPGETFLGTTEPRDGASPIAGPDWPSPSRAATVDREVPPGETGRFVFTVRAPDAPGDYPQYFNLVQESVAWFGDPGQGGPPDDQLQIRVTTLDVPPWEPPDAGVAAPPDAAVPPADGGPGGRSSLDGGCGCRASGATGSPAAAILLALTALTLRRRRRRSGPPPNRGRT